MKRKAIILIAISGIVTLSFTFASVNKHEVKRDATVKSSTEVPVGGFESDDKI